MMDIRLKKWYTDGKGKFCPWCMSEEMTHPLMGDLKRGKKNTIEAVVQCNTCKRIWKEIYILHTIEDTERDLSID